MENKNYIYGIKVDNKFYYIGKYSGKLNKNNLINKSESCISYNKDYKNIYNKQNIELIPIKEIENNWYSEKIDEIVKKYSENNPLQNKQWMLEGKRGFWQGTGGYWKGKKRDSNTLKRLTESKYKKIAQYDVDGNLIKVWDSYKDVAIKIFNDYNVNSSGKTKSKIYYHARKYSLKNNSYWIDVNELINEYSTIPVKLNFSELINSQKQKVIKTKVNFNNAKKNIYSVKYTKNNVTRTFNNCYEASDALKINPTEIRKLCRNNLKGFSYGEKIKQHFNKITK